VNHAPNVTGADPYFYPHRFRKLDQNTSAREEGTNQKTGTASHEKTGPNEKRVRRRNFLQAIIASWFRQGALTYYR
jgi:hypothetical protein